MAGVAPSGSTYEGKNEYWFIGTITQLTNLIPVWKVARSQGRSARASNCRRLPLSSPQRHREDQSHRQRDRWIIMDRIFGLQTDYRRVKRLLAAHKCQARVQKSDDAAPQ